MMNEDEVAKSAKKWTNYYAIRKNEIAQQDVAELLNKYNFTDEDAGRIMSALNLLATKEVVKRGGRNGWR